MRAFSLLAIVYAATIGATSALVDASDRTWVDVSATGYDERTSGNGCSPDGCVSANTRDGNTYANSRWSCQGDILHDDNQGCCITYSFEEPQDIVRMRIAFHKGNVNTRTLTVSDNGDHHSTITSSGSTLEYQDFDLYTDETATIKLCLFDYAWNTDVWLSIAEVIFLVEYRLHRFFPGLNITKPGNHYTLSASTFGVGVFCPACIDCFHT